VSNDNESVFDRAHRLEREQRQSPPHVDLLHGVSHAGVAAELLAIIERLHVEARLAESATPARLFALGMAGAAVMRLRADWCADDAPKPDRG
jgi:hypothetical protein